MKFNFRKIALFGILSFNSGVFILYGTAKLAGIQSLDGIPDTDARLGDLTSTQLMWYFFLTQRSYTVLVALAQIIPAVLILFRRSRLLGAILYFCSAINILAINIIFEIAPATLVLSLVLVMNILIVIYDERSKLKRLLD